MNHKQRNNKKGRLTAEEVRADMQEALDAAYASNDPKARANFRLLFGDKKPTLEEFIKKIAEEAHRRLAS